MNHKLLLLPVLMTGSLLCNTAFAANQRPVADKQAVSVNEDSATNPITLVATDADGDTLTYEIVQKPRKGTLTQASPSSASVTYTPNADYSGTDRFLFRVSDGKATSTLATVIITVQDVADAPPTATNIITNTKENAPVTFTLLGAGGNGATLNYAASTPANGSVSIRRDQATYTPNANFNGSDSFTYSATDGATTSTPATVNISVAAINTAPSAQDQTVEVTKDTPATITLSGADAEDPSPIFIVVRKPMHGTIDLFTGKTLTYTPHNGYLGGDSLSFQVEDSTGKKSRLATIRLNVEMPPAITKANVGYYDLSLRSGNVTQNIAITAAEQNPINIVDLFNDNFSNIQVLFIQNPDNSTYAHEYIKSSDKINSFINEGGVLVFHDRYVTNAQNIIPGVYSGFSRNMSDNNIDILNKSTAVTNGKNGILNSLSLDNGCSSSHGYFDSAYAPIGMTGILSKSDASQLVTFSYPYGKGYVIYSTIPLDYYLEGNDCNIGKAVREVYAPNIINYATQLHCCGEQANTGFLLNIK